MAGVFNELDRAEENCVPGFGLTLDEMRSVARRQLKGSAVAGTLIVAAAALIGIQSTHSSTPVTTAHSGVQQSVFVATSDHVIAAVKREIETP
jgi:hypothetical protein